MLEKGPGLVLSALSVIEFSSGGWFRNSLQAVGDPTFSFVSGDK
jgi:hypothetical protein